MEIDQEGMSTRISRSIIISEGKTHEADGFTVFATIDDVKRYMKDGKFVVYFSTRPCTLYDRVKLQEKKLTDFNNNLTELEVKNADLDMQVESLSKPKRASRKGNKSSM
jgi:hypothetical protein